jgi:hypothetical protein
VKISRLEPPIIVYRLVLRIVQTLRFDHCGIGEETAVYLGLLTHFYNPIGTKAFIEQCELQARMTDMSILAPRPQLHWPFFRGLTSSPSRTGCYICWRSGMLPWHPHERIDNWFGTSSAELNQYKVKDFCSRLSRVSSCFFLSGTSLFLKSVQLRTLFSQPRFIKNSNWNEFGFSFMVWIS